MKLAPLRADLRAYLRERELSGKGEKAKEVVERDIRYPSLHVELLEPRWYGIYSFRLDRKYRALFFIDHNGEAEVFAITNHYKK